MRRIATGFLGILLAAACGGSGTAQPAPGSPPPIVQLKVSIPVAKTAFAQADLAVADAEGFFKAQGLEVSFQNLASGVKSVDSVVAGDSDIGGSSIEPVLAAAAKGGVTIIGSYSDRLTVVMETASGISAPSDLKGKKLGIQDVGAFREVMTRAVYESAGLKQTDVQYVPVADTAYVSALLANKIDSAILQQEQSVDAEAKAPNMHVLADLYKTWPDYYYGTYFVKTDWLNSNRDVAKRFLVALTKAHRFMYSNRARTVADVAAVSGFSSDIIDKAYDRLIVKDGVFPVNAGLESARLTFTVNKMKEIGLLGSGAPDMSKAVDRGPINAAVQQLGGPMKGDSRWH